MSQNDINFLKLIKEYQYMTGADGTDPISKTDLPDPSLFKSVPTIVLQKHQVVRFRNHYAMLLDFAALKCNKDPKELCLLDLLVGLDLLPRTIMTDLDEEIC